MVTGGIQCHELAWGTTATGESGLWIVNTLFTCLAGLDPRWGFVPRWQPPFITQLAAQDRCHLNGLALREGAPAFVTVMATGNHHRRGSPGLVDPPNHRGGLSRRLPGPTPHCSHD